MGAKGVQEAVLYPASAQQGLECSEEHEAPRRSAIRAHDNTARYGPQLSAIPHLLSRYNFEFVDEDGNVAACTPGVGPPEGYRPQTKVLAGGDGEDTRMEQNGDGTGSDITLS